MAEAVRALSDLPRLGIPSRAATDERLASFLAAYRAGEGDTPTIEAMANHLGLPQEAVRASLGRLENAGRIHIISRSPLRIMLCKPEDGPYSPPPQDPERFSRFLEADAERHRLARFVGQFEQEHGRGPNLGEMVQFVGFASAGYVARMAEIMAKRGLMQFGRGLPTKLTEAGRQFYGMKGAKKMEQKTAEKGHQARVVIMKDRKPPAARIDDVCHALASYKAFAGEKETPTFGWLAQRIGYSRNSQTAVSDILREAEEIGLVTVESGRGYARAQFTEAGKARYMPAAEEEAGAGKVSDQQEPCATFSPEEHRRLGDIREVAAVPWQPLAPPPTAPAAAGSLAYVETAALVMELVERGYIVKRG